MPETYESHLVSGIATMLHASGFGVYSPGEPIATDGRPILTSFMPAQDPDVALWVLYLGSTNMPNNGVEVDFQVMTRGSVDGRMLDALDEGVKLGQFFQPNGYPLSQVTVGRVRLGQIRRLTFSRPLADDNRRWITSQSYRTRGKRFTV